ncbi:MAG: transcriptional repressor [Patescibacteria group bacterium]|nr:transcriptional repressor [Patescibacteria group bacterium]
MQKKSLKEQGYKLTKPRQLILDFFSRRSQPASVNQIYRALKAKIDKVTVYRVLAVLQEVGLIFEEPGEKESLYYAAKKQHHHIVCRVCGLSQCLPCTHFFSKIKNFSAIEHKMTISGLCKKCAH